MYAQVKKPEENKSSAIANSVAQMKSNGKQSFGFMDNRSETVTQRNLQELANDSSTKQLHSIQKKEGYIGKGVSVNGDAAEEKSASVFPVSSGCGPIQRVRFLSVKRIAQGGSLYEGINFAGPPNLNHNGGLTWWGPRATAQIYANGGGSMWRSTAASALNLVDMNTPAKLGKTMSETIRRTNNNLSQALQGVLQSHDFAYVVPHAVADTAQMCLDYAHDQYTNQNGQWTANAYVNQSDVDHALQLVGNANEISMWVGSVIQNFADHGSPNALQLDDANFLASPSNYVVLRKDATNLDAGFADALLNDLNQPNMAGDFHGLHVPAGMKFGGFSDTKHELLIRNSPVNLTQPIAPQNGDPDLRVSDKTLFVDDSQLARAWRWFGLNN